MCQRLSGCDHLSLQIYPRLPQCGRADAPAAAHDLAVAFGRDQLAGQRDVRVSSRNELLRELLGWPSPGKSPHGVKGAGRRAVTVG